MSFIDHGFRFELYAYEDIDAPRGVQVRDAREVLPASRVFTYQRGPGAGSVAAFANLFRYKLLLDAGGWWVDADVLCLRSALPSHEVVFGWESDQLLGNAVLKFPRGHWLMEKLYVATEEIIHDRGDNLEWGETGPNLFTRILRECDALEMAFASHYFYPIHFIESQLILRPDQAALVRRRTSNSLLFHLWNEMFRRAGSDPQSPPPGGSYLASVLAKYGSGLPRNIAKPPRTRY